MTVSVGKVRGHFLSDLLPYDCTVKEGSELRSGLHEYSFLSTVLTSMFEFFQGSKLEVFDGLVGENACQIRALRIALIVKDKVVGGSWLSTRIQAVQQEIEKLLSPKELSALMRKKVSLKDALTSNGLEIALSVEVLFLFRSYLLWEAKGTAVFLEAKAMCKRELAEPKKLQQFGNVSKRFTENLVRKVRRSLSEASVAFVQKCAEELKDPSLIQRVSEKYVVKHHDCWPCLPMFSTYKVLLRKAEDEKLPLVIHVKFESADEEKLLFKAGPQGYVEALPSREDLEVSAMVVEGLAFSRGGESWKIAFKTNSVIDVILAGAADHRQYPDETKDLDLPADQELQSYRELARTGGFSMDNPSTFFIQHVYAEKIGNLLI